MCPPDAQPHPLQDTATPHHSLPWVRLNPGKSYNLKQFLIKTLHICLIMLVLPHPLAPMRTHPLQNHTTVAAPARIRCYTNTNSSSLDKTDAIRHKRDGETMMKWWSLRNSQSLHMKKEKVLDTENIRLTYKFIHFIFSFFQLVHQMTLWLLLFPPATRGISGTQPSRLQIQIPIRYRYIRKQNVPLQMSKLLHVPLMRTTSTHTHTHTCIEHSFSMEYHRAQ